MGRSTCHNDVILDVLVLSATITRVGHVCVTVISKYNYIFML